MAGTQGLRKIYLSHRSEWITHFNHYRIEAAWKLASWEFLDSYLNCSVRNEKFSTITFLVR